jgi:hypothetical protein
MESSQALYKFEPREWVKVVADIIWKAWEVQESPEPAIHAALRWILDVERHHDEQRAKVLARVVLADLNAVASTYVTTEQAVEASFHGIKGSFKVSDAKRELALATKRLAGLVSLSTDLASLAEDPAGLSYVSDISKAVSRYCPDIDRRFQVRLHTLR